MESQSWQKQVKDDFSVELKYAARRIGVAAAIVGVGVFDATAANQVALVVQAGILQGGPWPIYSAAQATKNAASRLRTLLRH